MGNSPKFEAGNRRSCVLSVYERESLWACYANVDMSCLGQPFA